jgi:hypothetical protein
MELGLEQVAAHYAISSVFSSFADETEIFCYQRHRISYEVLNSGRGRLALGRARITSSITGQSAELLLRRSPLRRPEHYRGGESLCTRRRAKPPKHLSQRRPAEQVRNANFPEVIRLLDRYYDLDYSLISLFRDEQRRIIQIILNSTLPTSRARSRTSTTITPACCITSPRPACPNRRR